ncbi:energy-coupling factor transporter transmembrane component T [Methanobacterium alcaliphilum]|uniref:energy-coupling factor transporter transmembrane component T n=1 Tax=Methanobacterium alcaliphilum TaxID=392018 RepID=UPI00200A97BF|nr:energy-coupling factor transporter transmembrane component T [Methanobacterium alcaliphilum]MCK9152135.1 energy-coupling factor transporter transmembrane protein EcfT [Methanobacterium alcaliphilum]
MNSEILQSSNTISNFKIDPRTKIIVLVILNLMVFGEAPLYATISMVSIPFFLLLFNKRKKVALIYISAYTLALLGEIFLVPATHGILNLLIVMITNLLVRMMPGIIMGYYLIVTTTVSEFLASMEKTRIPKMISIPISVVFRFLPTLIEEIRAILDAMHMRGIGLNLKTVKSPLTVLEYILVPLLINAVKTGDELSAASLTRGLGNPIKRTHICEVGFHIQDIILLTISVAALIIFLLFK